MHIDVIDLDQTLTENFVKFCCEHLDVYPEVISVEGWDTPLLINNATGLCYEVEHDYEYLIHVYTRNRNVTEIYNTVAHEMIHIKQFMKQDLDNVIKFHKPIYSERWWEKEASDNSYDIVKKYVDTLYEMV